VALKDMISVKDVPMLMGTEFVTGFTPDIDATVTTRILEAGGEITGKAVCENLCHSGTSHSAASGKVENPWCKGYSSGGSSSGSGVLVALGEVDMSIGADQGGSVRSVSSLRPFNAIADFISPEQQYPSNQLRRRRSQADLWPDSIHRLRQQRAYERSSRTYDQNRIE
jgi:hypothetical protein